MKRSNAMKTQLKPAAAAVALLLAAGPAWALQDIYLAAKAFDKTLPDGSTVTMWGYAEDADTDGNGVGQCWEAGKRAARRHCVAGLTATVPGPRLTVTDPAGDIRIRLTNALPEPTSIVIPGQKLPQNVVGPTWSDGTTGARVQTSQRVRSFGVEANPNGSRRAYVWRQYRSAHTLLA
jgi:hypothetical protein